MNLFYAKVRLIFLPFLIITVGTIAIYTFLNWLLIVKLNTFNVEEDVANLFIPIAIPMYGDTGKYGALAVETRGFKVKNEQPFTKIAPALWLAVKYSKTISNHLSLKEKDIRYHKFALQSNAAFLGQRFDNFTYLNRIPYSNDLKNFNSAVTLRGDVVDGAKTILLPVFKPFADRNGYQLVWLLSSFIIGSGIFLLMLHFNQLKENAEY